MIKTSSVLTVPKASTKPDKTKSKPSNKKKSIELVLPYSSYMIKPLKA